MRSGKPPLRWKRKRRRGVSVGRIGVLVVLLGAVAAVALWRLRPMPLPWHDVGSGNTVTPALDASGADSRDALLRLARYRIPELGDESLVEVCRADAAIPVEVYVLERVYRTSHWTDSTRTLVLLNTDGVAIVRRGSGVNLEVTSRRRVDEAEAEAFRTLLSAATLGEMTPFFARNPNPTPPRRGDADVVSLQICIRGRYFAVVRDDSGAPDAGFLQEIAARIEAFAAAEPSRSLTTPGRPE
jgi:hypothetical protein